MEISPAEKFFKALEPESPPPARLIIHSTFGLSSSPNRAIKRWEPPPGGRCNSSESLQITDDRGEASHQSEGLEWKYYLKSTLGKWAELLSTGV